MNIKCVVAALPLVLSLSIPASVAARAESGARPPAYPTGGREVAAPSWSAACMTDQGPSQCGEPMWVYGSSGALSRYRSAF
jgi:hypothetical protein